MVQGGQCPEHHPQQARELTEPASPLAPTRLLGIDHVQLAMPAGEQAEREAERFYAGVLGLTRVPKPPDLAVRGGCWFAGPQVQLHLGVEDDFRPATKAHPALLVDDLDVVCQRIVAGGGEVRSADGLPGVARVHTDDPFGNRIELIQAVGPADEVFRTMAEHSIFPLALVDNTGSLAWVSESIERFFGWRADELVGHSFAKVIAPDSLPAVVDAFTAIDDAFEVTPWGGVGFPADLVHADGTVTACELSVLTSQRSGLPWYVVTVRRVGYERALDLAVQAMAEGAGLAEILARLVGALEHMAPDSLRGDRRPLDRRAVRRRGRHPRAPAERRRHEPLGAGPRRRHRHLDARPHRPATDPGRARRRRGLPGLLGAPGDRPRRRGASGGDRDLADAAGHPDPLHVDDGHARRPAAAADAAMARQPPHAAVRGHPRPAHRAGQPAGVPRARCRPWPPPARAAPPSCSSTSTTSSPSTRRWATPSATGSWPSSPTAWSACCAPATSWPASAATSSRCCASASPTQPTSRRWPGGCWRRSANRCVPRRAWRPRCAVDASIGITALDPSEPVDTTLARVDQAMREAKVTGRGRWVRYPTP